MVKDKNFNIHQNLKIFPMTDYDNALTMSSETPAGVTSDEDPCEQNKASNKNNTKRILAFQFLGQFKTMNKNMNERQIDYAVYKSLLFVMR